MKSFRDFFQPLCSTDPANWADVEDWCSEKQTGSSMSSETPKNLVSSPFQSNSTEAVNISSDDNILAVSSEWVSKYITSYVRTIRDCFISEFNNMKRKTVPFGVYKNSTDMDVDL